MITFLLRYGTVVRRIKVVLLRSTIRTHWLAVAAFFDPPSRRLFPIFVWIWIHLRFAFRLYGDLFQQSFHPTSRCALQSSALRSTTLVLQASTRRPPASSGTSTRSCLGTYYQDTPQLLWRTSEEEISIGILPSKIILQQTRYHGSLTSFAHSESLHVYEPFASYLVFVAEAFNGVVHVLYFVGPKTPTSRHLPTQVLAPDGRA